MEQKSTHHRDPSHKCDQIHSRHRQSAPRSYRRRGFRHSVATGARWLWRGPVDSFGRLGKLITKFYYFVKWHAASSCYFKTEWISTWLRFSLYRLSFHAHANALLVSAILTAITLSLVNYTLKQINFSQMASFALIPVCDRDTSMSALCVQFVWRSLY